MNLPKDLVKFLKSRKQLQYDPNLIEPGEVKLLPFEDIKPGVVWINSDQAPFEDDDPHIGEDGYYEVPAISLTGECKSYNPEFLLLWLPNEKLYGTWDSDHWDLYVFNDVAWSDIVKSPEVYLDALWNDYDREVGEYFKPFPKYKFKKGMPF